MVLVLVGGGAGQGRANKDADTCYSFWVGAALDALGAGPLADWPASAAFTRRCEARALREFESTARNYRILLFGV